MPPSLPKPIDISVNNRFLTLTIKQKNTVGNIVKSITEDESFEGYKSKQRTTITLLKLQKGDEDIKLATLSIDNNYINHTHYLNFKGKIIGAIKSRKKEIIEKTDYHPILITNASSTTCGIVNAVAALNDETLTSEQVALGNALKYVNEGYQVSIEAMVTTSLSQSKAKNKTILTSITLKNGNTIPIKKNSRGFNEIDLHAAFRRVQLDMLKNLTPSSNRNYPDLEKTLKLKQKTADKKKQLHDIFMRIQSLCNVSTNQQVVTLLEELCKKHLNNADNPSHFFNKNRPIALIKSEMLNLISSENKKAIETYFKQIEDICHEKTNNAPTRNQLTSSYSELSFSEAPPTISNAGSLPLKRARSGKNAAVKNARKIRKTSSSQSIHPSILGHFRREETKHSSSQPTIINGQSPKAYFAQFAYTPPTGKS